MIILFVLAALTTGNLIYVESGASIFHLGVFWLTGLVIGMWTMEQR